MKPQSRFFKATSLTPLSLLSIFALSAFTVVTQTSAEDKKSEEAAPARVVRIEKVFDIEGFEKKFVALSADHQKLKEQTDRLESDLRITSAELESAKKKIETLELSQKQASTQMAPLAGEVPAAILPEITKSQSVVQTNELIGAENLKDMSPLADSSIIQSPVQQ